MCRGSCSPGVVFIRMVLYLVEVVGWEGDDGRFGT